MHATASRGARYAALVRPLTRARYAVLPSILVAAAALRFWGLSAGLPFAPGTDEPVIVSQAVRMMKTGDLNPHFFDYPSLYLYIQLATSVVRFLAGAVHGQWASLDQVGTEDFYLWARAINAILGVATVALVYACGAHWNRAHAALAAAFAAVFPLHVRESHFALTDVPVTFFTALALLFSLRASSAPSLRAFIAAGAAAGLAMATKYNGGLVIVLPLIAAASCRGRNRLTLSGAATASMGAFFLLGAPYTLLDLPAFLNGFAALARHYAPRPDQEAGWSVYLKHLNIAITTGGMALVLGGLALSLVRGLRPPTPARHWLLVVFPLVYFAFVSRQGLIFGRYLLPLTPFIALSMAVAILAIPGLLRRVRVAAWQQTAIAAAVAVLAIWPQASDAVGFNRQMGRQSTHEAAYGWLLANVPHGSKVVSERFELRLPEKHYRVEGQVRLINRSYDDYVRSGVGYLIASSYVFGPVLDPRFGDERGRQAYEALFSRAQEVYRVAPGHGLAGPEIRVYAVAAGK